MKQKILYGIFRSRVAQISDDSCAIGCNARLEPVDAVLVSLPLRSTALLYRYLSTESVISDMLGVSTMFVRMVKITYHFLTSHFVMSRSRSGPAAFVIQESVPFPPTAHLDESWIMDTIEICMAVPTKDNAIPDR